MVVANETPLSIGKVTLTVHDLDGMSDFYQRVIGLRAHRAEAGRVVLGNGRNALLELVGDPAARRSSRREAGLFHTAFLLHTRAELGRFLHHLGTLGLRLDGAADHIVSEAVYLHDPEGNGIEVYRDRPDDAWPRRDGQIAMRNDPLDFEGILAEGAGHRWDGIPESGIVGHVHLQVGELSAAEAFYTRTLGLDVTCRFPGAVFYSSGGYHHHLATNIWNSRGAVMRSFPATGLAEIELLRHGLPMGQGTEMQRHVDPWGTVLSVQAFPA